MRAPSEATCRPALASLVSRGYLPGQEQIIDGFGRTVTYLRIAITDLCNLRCIYCMPPEGISWLPREAILSFEELETVVEAAAACGISKIRLTGGEPLIRKNLPRLVERLATVPGIEELTLTTNGVYLEQFAHPLAQAGMSRVNVSLDTLDPRKFRRITRLGRLEDVLRGLDAAAQAGLTPLKVNTVVMGGLNDEEVPELAALSLERPVEVRFIEYMPLEEAKGCARSSGAFNFVANEVTRARIKARWGPLEALPSWGERDGPATRFRIASAAGSLGFIGAMSAPFCQRCNRLRLTADGEIRSCLLEGGSVDVKAILRSGGSRPEIMAALRRVAMLKPEVHGSLTGAYRGSMSRIGG